jgi:aryl-alcohol dehydrogenase-like predicted oxidoreductase
VIPKFMSRIMLHNTGIQTTALGFGCGGLMRVTSARQRQRILSEAFDAGIAHFDVAPVYGLGRIETEVGKFSQGRRERLVLATKFGLQVKKASGIASAVQGVGRRVLAMIPALRRAVRNRSSMFYAPKNFDVATAKRSLEESLRALRTDYIDIFLLHEPELAAVKDTGVWEYLQRAKELGLIRAWGVAGYPGQIKPVCDAIPALVKVIQTPNDVVSHQLEQFRVYSDAGLITFSPYSGAYDKLRALMTDNPDLVEEFMRTTNIDLRHRGTLAKLMLGYCLRANSSGVTLFFSGRAEGVGENAAAWKNGYSEESVRAFEGLVRRVIGRGSKYAK